MVQEPCYYFLRYEVIVRVCMSPPPNGTHYYIEGQAVSRGPAVDKGSITYAKSPLEISRSRFRQVPKWTADDLQTK